MDFVGSVIGGAVDAATGKGGASKVTIFIISLWPDVIFVKTFIQGGFFHWHPPISAPKRKLLASQLELLLLRKAVIGCLAGFLFGIEIGGCL